MPFRYTSRLSTTILHCQKHLYARMKKHNMGSFAPQSRALDLSVSICDAKNDDNAHSSTSPCITCTNLSAFRIADYCVIGKLQNSQKRC
jgi:hypothetical protein